MAIILCQFLSYQQVFIVMLQLLPTSGIMPRLNMDAFGFQSVNYLEYFVLCTWIDFLNTGFLSYAFSQQSVDNNNNKKNHGIG